MAMRSRTSSPAKRKIIFARGEFSGTNQGGGFTSRFEPLALFENGYGAQLLGATIMGIRGVVSTRNRSTVTTTIQAFNYGFIVEKAEASDLQTTSPTTSPVSNDRFGQWLWWEGWHTFPALAAVVGDSATCDVYRHHFQVRARRKLAQLEDTLFFVCSSPTVAGGNLDWGLQYSVAVALP
jgi:hypothetical protein